MSNDSVYTLTFDTSLLKKGRARMKPFCVCWSCVKKRVFHWTDPLFPISDTAPYLYKLEAVSDGQRRQFFTYVKSLKEARSLLEAYCCGIRSWRSPKTLPAAPAEDALRPPPLRRSWAGSCWRISPLRIYQPAAQQRRPDARQTGKADGGKSGDPRRLRPGRCLASATDWLCGGQTATPAMCWWRMWTSS